MNKTMISLSVIVTSLNYLLTCLGAKDYDIAMIIQCVYLICSSIEIILLGYIKKVQFFGFYVNTM